MVLQVEEQVSPTTVLLDGMNCQPNDAGETLTYAKLTGDARFAVDAPSGAISLTSNLIFSHSLTYFELKCQKK